MIKMLDVWLFLVYYVWIVPVSLIIKCLGNDILDMNFQKKKDTYWTNHVEVKSR